MRVSPGLLREHTALAYAGKGGLAVRLPIQPHPQLPARATLSGFLKRAS